jgi:hypothetical protein
MRPFRRLAAASCVALLASIAAACAATSISDVRARAGELAGREVTVEGQVVDTLALPLLGSRYYQLDDGTGQLWVETRSAVPGEGVRVRASGVLAPGLKVGTVELGLVLQESRRR